MSDKKPLILITNDDGITSKGITELINLAQKLGKGLWWLPTYRARTTKCLMVENPIYSQKLPSTNENVELFQCSGTRPIV